MRKRGLIEIKSDVFDIADRIKEVDEEYRLYYDPESMRYEVHKRDEICITWTEPLSAALIVKLRETHVRRRLALLAEIERSEERARREDESRTHEIVGEATERFLARGGLSAFPSP